MSDKKNDKKTEEINFEEAIDKVKSLIGEIEKGEINLEAVLEKFEEGKELLGKLNDKLDEVQEKVEEEK